LKFGNLKTNPNGLVFQGPNYPITKLQNLFHFLMRRVLAATLAKLLHLQPIGRGLAILGRRVIALFAIAALHRDDFSGHENRS
jgi:hypothetical protein